MQLHSISSPEGVTSYWTGGAGEAVVLLHGAAMDHGVWKEQIPELASNFRVIVPDLPSHGASRPYTTFSIAHCAEIILRILDREEVDVAHLVGQSMGGYISQVVAVEHSDRVRSFVAVDSSPLDARYYSWSDRWLLSVVPAILHIYPYRTLVHSVARQIATSDRGRAYALATLTGLSKREIVDIMAAVYGGLMHYAGRGLKLTCPIAVIYGAEDRTGKVVAYSRRWAEQEALPLHVIPNAGHISNLDNPHDFNAALLAFLSRVSLHPNARTTVAAGGRQP